MDPVPAWLAVEVTGNDSFAFGGSTAELPGSVDESIRVTLYVLSGLVDTMQNRSAAKPGPCEIALCLSVVRLISARAGMVMEIETRPFDVAPSDPAEAAGGAIAEADTSAIMAVNLKLFTPFPQMVKT